MKRLLLTGTSGFRGSGMADMAAAAVCLQCGRAVFLLLVFRMETFRSYFASSGSSTPSFSAWAVRTARAP